MASIGLKTNFDTNSIWRWSWGASHNQILDALVYTPIREVCRAAALNLQHGDPP
jgi:hypothetical protein